MFKKTILCLLTACLSSAASMADDVIWFDGSHPVSYFINGKSAPVVSIAADMFSGDMLQVTGKRALSQKKNATIQIFQLDQLSSSAKKTLYKKGVPVDELSSMMDAFYVAPCDGQILVVGNNGRGCAYGLLELSREAGVSPWVWWGDVVPEHKSRLTMSETFRTQQSPSVAFRGIFINDEDWSLRNWAWTNYEKSEKFGTIGPKTYKAVFQLLLRLRANAIWPAMHEGTSGFFTVKGNKEIADSCGILIGTSHCEPLLRNNVAEWDHEKRGAYNFISNRSQVKNYWAERLQQVAGSEELFTIGMRGIHDGSMEGVKTPKEKLDGLQQVIDEQRELLAKYINKDVTKVPQIFIPYKEVLDIYESGLRVPDDVTLMWCDDNYGYMTRLSDAEQQKRKGGAGVYYHLSYWGRPHDYLWLTTTQPGLIYSEMKAAYDHNARKLWIVNVHDPKVAAYDLEFFLDMAWNINAIQPQTINQHLEHWLCRQFGEKAGKMLVPAMQDYYRLCAIRKPEFMGWTQVELDKKIYPRGRSQVTDTEFSQSEFGNELARYLRDYNKVAKTIEAARQHIRPELADAYFAAIEYPVLSAAAMATKMLHAQIARSRFMGQTDAKMMGREENAARHAAMSMGAYSLIVNMTERYNNMVDGKWKGLMNMMPRDNYVFFPPTLPYYDHRQKAAPVTVNCNDDALSATDFIARNACDYQQSSAKAEPIQMLGHSMNAVALPKGTSLTFEFDAKHDGQATLYTAMIPTQPNDKGDLRYSVQIDNGEHVVISLKEKFRSEPWKKNVLRAQALKNTPITLTKGKHTLTVKALDDHIIMDQWMIDFKQGRKFYVIPIEH